MQKLLITLFIFLSINMAQSIETKIIHNIENEIITNIDIKNEFKYLLALNNSLKELDKERILNISNESIIKEKIKKIEILKNYKEIKINDDYLKILLENTYLRLELKSLVEFKSYLKEYGLKLNDVKKKLTIDALWNQLILRKYKSQISINKEKIKKELSKNVKKKSKEYQLSEIIFEIENKEQIKTKYEEIIKNINEFGFKNSASLYSISDTAKTGGGIGWINENSLNNKIKKNINFLKVGEISKPIILSNGILILKVINTRYSEIKIDYELELTKAINYERNRQLNQFSKIYFNKIKINTSISEL